MADAEEERVLVVGEVDLLGLGAREQLLQLLQSLARNQNALLAADAFETSLGFSTYESRWPSVATMASDSALMTSSAPLSV